MKIQSKLLKKKAAGKIHTSNTYGFYWSLLQRSEEQEGCLYTSCIVI